MAANTTKTTTGNFAALSAEITYNPKTSEGRGFLPPFLRACGHLLYALGIAEDDLPKDKGDTTKETATIKRIEDEIDQAITHFDKVEISDAFSSVAQSQLKTFAKALTALRSEYKDWDKDTKISNTMSLIHKAHGVSAMLDRELIGLRNSDPGSSL